MAHILLESRGREAPEGECNIEPLHSSLYNNLLVVGAYLYGKLCNSSSPNGIDAAASPAFPISKIQGRRKD